MRLLDSDAGGSRCLTVSYRSAFDAGGERIRTGWRTPLLFAVGRCRKGEERLCRLNGEPCDCSLQWSETKLVTSWRSFRPCPDLFPRGETEGAALSAPLRAWYRANFVSGVGNVGAATSEFARADTALFCNFAEIGGQSDPHTRHSSLIGRANFGVWRRAGSQASPGARRCRYAL
jgi:hypothetical protein